MSTIWFKAVKEFISKKSSSLTHMGNGTLTGTLYPCKRYWSVAMRRSCAISNIISTDPVYKNLYKNRMSVNKKSSSQFGDGAVMQTRFNLIWVVQGLIWFLVLNLIQIDQESLSFCKIKLEVEGLQVFKDDKLDRIEKENNGIKV